jgi:peptide/nickel transport system permease protein
MAGFIARRMFMTALSLIGVTIIVFVLARVQGDPRAIYVDDFTLQKDYEEWGRRLGFDKPIYHQYGLFVWKALHGDFGRSQHQSRPVIELILPRLPASAQLAFAGLIVSVSVGVPLGVMSAVYRGTIWDLFGRWFSVLGVALPVFWVGIMSILLFAVLLGWLPTSGRGGLSHLILPAVVVGWGALAGQLRLTRSSMLEVLDSEYVKLARAKGVAGWRVVWIHAFRNALIAPLTYAGLTLAGLITGTIVVEVVFAWPGLGQLSLQAVRQSDYAVIQAVILIITFFYLVSSLVIDLLYAVVDPRIRIAT